MICFLLELGLIKDFEGIYIFELENFQLGSDIMFLFGLDDVILDLIIIVNCVDVLSMIGVVCEVVVLIGVFLRILNVFEVMFLEQGNDSSIKIDILELKVCFIYIGIVIEGVKISFLLVWLKQCLELVGIRVINNVVDIINYILLEWGQLFYGFDKDKIQVIIVSKFLIIGVCYVRVKESFIILDI